MRTKGLLTLLLAFATTAQAQSLSVSGRYELDRYLSQAVNESHIPGLVALVTNGDRVIYHSAFGLMGTANSKAMTRDAIFLIASMTKPVTSLAVMMLVEQGQVNLDDPIEKYLPDLANREVFTEFDLEAGTFKSRPAERSITIRHLLTHTSGLGYTFASPELAKALGINPQATATTLPLLHEPGENWTYGESTRVLGHLVEAVTGQELFAWMQDHILEPLHMIDTNFDIPAGKNARTVTVYRTDGTKLVEQPNPAGVISSPHNGDGGLASTADDYAHFIRLFLNDGMTDDGRRLVSADTVNNIGRNHMGNLTVRQMPTTSRLVSEPFPLGAGVDTFGLGFQITEQQLPDSRAPGSMAWAGIFNTEFWIDRENDIGAVLMMQYLPFYDARAIEVLQGFEHRIYRSLEGAGG
jgi:methyl acetate hydrolase